MGEGINMIDNIKWIDNDKEKGIQYDWSKILKEYKKLKCPKDVYNPCTLPVQKAKVNVLCSDRSRGKTTNLLLLGMVMYKLYGTQIQYLRSTVEQITPKNSREIFSTILEYDYVQKLTDGKYNSIRYNARAWYYCLVDADGNIVEQSPDHFMFSLAVEKWEDYKSSYNAPRGDFIIFDEFIRKFYPPDEFLGLQQLIKTIIRDRISPVVVMSANTINKHSQYFNELEIYDTVQLMDKGDSEIVTTSKGTNVYVELLGDLETTSERYTKRALNNRLFFGFSNPKMASITGASLWDLDSYPHIRRTETRESLYRNIYIEHNNKLVNIEIVTDDEIGLQAIVHWATTTYDDSYIFTLGEIQDTRYHYKLGSSNACHRLWQLYRNNLFFYATNDVGAFVENYISQCKVYF